MILRAEPRKVMRFVEDNFEILRDLYQVQLKENLIPAEAFDMVTRHEGDIITRRLLNYKLLNEVGDDFRMVEQVGSYIGFLTKEFKPMLPEQLRRYHGSISDLYSLLNVQRNIDDMTRALRLERLYDEIQSFLDSVTNNTYTLLKRTQRLKINRRQLTYAQRLREAKQLITNYIDPLTNIVALGNDNSIASLLRDISRKINLDRLDGHAPTVLNRYQQLDDLLRTVNRRLLAEAATISRELTPLIDRIQRESEVLGGFLSFLERPLLTPVPDMGHRHKQQIFGDQTLADARMYLEQFARARQRPAIDLSAAPASTVRLVFNRKAERQRLTAALPLEDFFGWCAPSLEHVAEAEREYHLLSLISLLFSDTSRYSLTFHEAYQNMTLGSTHYRLPRIAVTLATKDEAVAP